MNFLSHYFKDEHLSNPYFVAGIATPDLFKGFTRVYNRHIRDKLVLPSPESKAFHDGLLRHFEVDAHFHSQPIFKQRLDEFTIEIRNCNLSTINKRINFLAHIMIELLLDQIIIKHQPKILTQYYHLLYGVDVAELERFFIAHGLFGVKEVYINQFQRFRTVQYLKAYENNSGVMYALLRVYKRATKREISSTDAYLLEKKLPTFVKILEDDWKEIFDAIPHYNAA